MRLRHTKDAVVTLEDNQETKDFLFRTIVDWFFYQETFNKESIEQSDVVDLYASELLSTIAENILKFQVRYK